MLMIGRLTSLFRQIFGKKKDALPRSGYNYTLPGRPLQRSRKDACFTFLLILLVLVFCWLVFFPPFSWQGLTNVMRLPASISKAIGQDVLGEENAEDQQDRPILRGTIYDRNMEEMSVSYRLFSLLVQPTELPDRNKVAEQLSLILEREKEKILQQLQYADGMTELADNLEMHQVEAIEDLHLPGIHCRPVEVRYYPDHGVAGQVLGFVSGNAGLSGVEALYDTVLEPGEFRPVNIPVVNFAGHDALGETVADIVLTIDMALQRQLDQILAEYRQRKGASGGSAIAIAPDSGRILAMISQPGFDPNYFWQTDELQAHKALFAPRYDQELVRPLLVRAAATLEMGMDRDLLPVTLSVPDYGLSEDLLQEYWLRLDMGLPIPDFLPLSSAQGRASAQDMGDNNLLSPVQIVYGLATLLNGGHRVVPWFLNGLYDHTEERFFLRDFAGSPEARILSPAQGKRLGNTLLGASFSSAEGGFLFADMITKVSKEKGLSRQLVQDLLVVAVPREKPEVLLLLTANYDTLAPYPSEVEKRDLQGLLGIGKNVLPLLVGYGGQVETFTAPSAEKNPANLKRYFYSKKHNAAEVKETLARAHLVMPSLIGLSLRKGLQQLNRYNIKIQIKGSGRIIEQKPAPGEPLDETEICELILETEHE
ncbi:MAG: PASTA domain-containing protein [Candidatus Electrothrix aestuarii]|uniref:beta-lactamase n=1 Tax=Candidatus Electrothrix aestuarii TaxID=3062594 RepID=A0AAU8LYD4_9BACT